MSWRATLSSAEVMEIWKNAINSFKSLGDVMTNVFVFINIL